MKIHHSYAFARFFRLLVLASLLAGCSQSYVVLLPEADGSLGKVQITTPEGQTLLDKANEGAELGGKPGNTFTVSQEQIDKDFGQALASSPKLPVSYNLYFIQGGAELTPDSKAEIERVYAEIKSRPAPDLSVIGHTDTVGRAEENERLSLERAEATANLLKQNLTGEIKVTIESHGESNLLIKTPDDTPEPRNRRVEVTIR